MSNLKPMATTVFSGVRVVAEPKARVAGSTELVDVRFAFNPGGDRYESQFITATFAGKAAEQAATLKKGAVINVTGTVQERKWVGKKDGKENISKEIPYPSGWAFPKADDEATTAPADDSDIPF